MEEELNDVEDEIEDEGNEFEDFGAELNVFIPDEEDTQEEGGDEDDSVVDEITRQVAMLGSSISEVSLLHDHLLLCVFHYLPLRDLLSASLVCQNWHQIIISSDALWKPQYLAIRSPITTYLPISSFYERYLLHTQRKAILREHDYTPDEILEMAVEGNTIDIAELDLLVAAPTFAASLQSGEPNLLDLMQEKW
eukprot:CAMPEP_0117081202 /NCGR_PEP_ID=MMETSP0472-20121206/57248_1 /TAXON_ID=693140 ORGANISM="Tiarina fusus, Strain LIS" /NCGR_SAMPLE_ID=MMETSP0472 /ASSEMBLY_ACC=CAM_ASM_000603 /LENGTH=193 /DNA_ID=CAMNT_0004809067 /DNA_START=24 /DNA_END=602 /DNA_ORIENTATION=+